MSHIIVIYNHIRLKHLYGDPFIGCNYAQLDDPIKCWQWQKKGGDVHEERVDHWKEVAPND